MLSSLASVFQSARAGSAATSLIQAGSRVVQQLWRPAFSHVRTYGSRSLRKASRSKGGVAAGGCILAVSAEELPDFLKQSQAATLEVELRGESLSAEQERFMQGCFIQGASALEAEAPVDRACSSGGFSSGSFASRLDLSALGHLVSPSPAGSRIQSSARPSVGGVGGQRRFFASARRSAAHFIPSERLSPKPAQEPQEPQEFIDAEFVEVDPEQRSSAGKQGVQMGMGLTTAAVAADEAGCPLGGAACDAIAALFSSGALESFPTEMILLGLLSLGIALLPLFQEDPEAREQKLRRFVSEAADRQIALEEQARLDAAETARRSGASLEAEEELEPEEEERERETRYQSWWWKGWNFCLMALQWALPIFIIAGMLGGGHYPHYPGRLTSVPGMGWDDVLGSTLSWTNGSSVCYSLL